ncbi:MAG: hypothetical protein P0S94_03080, partial [Simkaniaceae bacterium]|nr:hypothetical protein [Simkaniaceae bacterium]
MKKALFSELPVVPRSFDEIDHVIDSLKGKSFKAFNRVEKNHAVNEALANLIEKHDKRKFLLPEVIDFIARVAGSGIIDKYSFSEFELWLNQFSGMSQIKKQKLRALITGKNIPRDEYQAFFPIGMGKQYDGTHFVTAHTSPDLDTMVASFWGWLDSFSAQVGKGLHVWNVPGGAPPAHVEVDLLFYQMLGEQVFTALAKTRGELTLSSLDLVTQEGYLVKRPHDLMLTTYHDRNQNAVVMVDNEGYYAGDWRPFDVEGVRQVIMLLNSCLRWLESHLHVRLITLFAQEKLTRKDFDQFVDVTFRETIKNLEPAKEFTTRQLWLLDKYLKDVLECEKGIETDLTNFTKAIEGQNITDFGQFRDELTSLSASTIFDNKGDLVENRPLIFGALEKIVKSLETVFRSFRYYVERFEIALKIKTDVFGFFAQPLSHRTDIREIRSKMDGYPYLTVTVLDKEGCRLPLGVIHSSELQKPHLGTVTLRDFSNRSETKIPDYLEVISIIDHHKTSFSTSSTPMAIIADAQSSNAIVADIAFGIYDRYSTGGLTKAKIDSQIADLRKMPLDSRNIRLLHRLYSRKMVLEQGREGSVAPEREKLEYLHYLYAILDDTDLLTKVSRKDVDVLMNLLNRLTSLYKKQECEIVNFDGIFEDESYVRNAAIRLLKNPELFYLYSRVYEKKEKIIEENLIRCSEGLPSSVFSDTKIQNTCARVGQTKLFAKNFGVYEKLASDMRNYWMKHARYVVRENTEIDLHIHCISTVASADEMHSGNKIDYWHQDEMWIWIPFTDLSIEHLKLFLNAFKQSPQMQNDLSATFYGTRASDLATLFKESFR